MHLIFPCSYILLICLKNINCCKYYQFLYILDCEKNSSSNLFNQSYLLKYICGIMSMVLVKTHGFENQYWDCLSWGILEKHWISICTKSRTTNTQGKKLFLCTGGTTGIQMWHLAWNVRQVTRTATFIVYLLCAKHRAKHLIWITHFFSQNEFAKLVFSKIRRIHWRWKKHPCKSYFALRLKARICLKLKANHTLWH